MGEGQEHMAYVWSEDNLRLLPTVQGLGNTRRSSGLVVPVLPFTH